MLASASPRRREILTQLGIPFDLRPAHVDEIESGDPEHVALENARRKARAVERPGELVLACDTVVTLDGRNHAKPADASEAAAMLRALSRRTHTVISGLVLGGWETMAATRVTFRDVEPFLDGYIESEEWRDRAGGYAIQGLGAALVTRIDGDYFNVVGLPVAALLELLLRRAARERQPDA